MIADSLGAVHLWSIAYREILKVQCLEISSVFDSQEIRSFDCTDEGRRFVIGTVNSEIYEVITPDLTISSNSSYQVKDVLKAPYVPGDYKEGGSQGLAIFTAPKLAERFLTFAEDNILRVWSISLRKQMAVLPLDASDSVTIKNSSKKPQLTALTLSQREDSAAVGFSTGLIKVLYFDEDNQLAEFDHR